MTKQILYVLNLLSTARASRLLRRSAASFLAMTVSTCYSLIILFSSFAMPFPKIIVFLKDASRTITRFPLSATSGIVFSVIGWIFVEISRYPSDVEISPYLKAIFAAALSMVLFTGLTLLAETLFQKRDSRILFSLVGIAIPLAYYFLTPDFSFMSGAKNAAIQFILLLFGFLIFFFLSPYLKNRKNFPSFLFYAALRLLFTIVATMVVFAGISLALFSIEQLFTVDMPNEIYMKIWYLSVGIFALLFFLKGIPEDFSIFEKKTPYPLILSLFVRYALIPLNIAYLGILYVYLAKILITQNWPEGWVALPVLILGLLGSVIHIFIFPLLKETRFATLFVRIYYPALIPLLLMLFTAFWKRIGQYGLTELRYLGVLAGIWLVIVAAIYLLKPKNDIRILLASACALIILSSFGPWDAFQLSENSQIHRLEKLVQEAKANASISRTTANEIYSIVTYMIETYGVEKLDPLFTADLNKISSQKNQGFVNYDWWEKRNQVIQAIMTELNLENFEPYAHFKPSEDYFQFDEWLFQGKKYVYSPESFDFVGPFMLSFPCCEPDTTATFYTETGDEKITLEISHDGKDLDFQWGEEKLSFDIAHFISDLREKAENNTLQRSDFQITAGNEKISVRLIFSSYLNGEEKNGILKNLNTSGMIFVKKLST